MLARTSSDGVPWPVGETWMSEGACRHYPPDMFFPEWGTWAEAAPRAQRICAECPVWKECRRYAIQTGQEFGIWGGLTEQELHAIVRRLARARAKRAAAAE